MVTNETYKVIKYQNSKEFLDNTQSQLENDEIFNTFVLWICDVLANTSSSTTIAQAPHSCSAIFEHDQLAYVYVCADGCSYVGWCGKQRQQIDTGNIHLMDAIKEIILIGLPLAQVSKLHGYGPVVNVFAQIREVLHSSSLSLTVASDTPTSNRSVNNKSSLVMYNLWSYQVTNAQCILWTDKTRQLAQRATLRLATWMDLTLLVKWGEAFVQDCGLNDVDDGFWNRCAMDIQNSNAYFWCLDDGVPMAMIWKRRALRHGISLAYVYTPNESRGCGYARTMVAQMTEFLLENEGYHYVTLLVDGDRDPVKNMYTSVGYQMVGSVARFDYQDDP